MDINAHLFIESNQTQLKKRFILQLNESVHWNKSNCGSYTIIKLGAKHSVMHSHWISIVNKTRLKGK